MSTVLEGGCHCGAVRYRVTDPTGSCLCHCESCRRSAGAPYVGWGTCPKAGFQLLRGTLHDHSSSPGVHRGRCGTCGTALTYANDEREADMDFTLASLDDPAAWPPSCHIWCEDKLDWIVPGDGLPQYPRWRTAGGAA